MITDACTLFAALIDAEVRAWSTIKSVLSEAGSALTFGRLSVLRTVRDTLACRTQEVAAGQGTTLGAASCLVDRFHHGGLPYRAPYEHDRRATILTVTEQGLIHLEKTYAIVERKQECLFAPLLTAQRKGLTRCLALIAKAAKERTRFA